VSVAAGGREEVKESRSANGRVKLHAHTTKKWELKNKELRMGSQKDRKRSAQGPSHIEKVGATGLEKT